MEEYLLSGQPTELLYNQLRDPAVTFRDIVNFIQINRAVEELFRKDDRFRELKEGKRVAVMITVDIEQDIEQVDEIIVLVIWLKFHHYLKTFQTTYNLFITRESVLDSAENDFQEILNIPKILKEKGSFEVELDEVIFDKQGETVEIKTEGHVGQVTEYKLPFDFFESIWEVVRDLAKDGKPSITAKILLNGDVIYEE